MQNQNATDPLRFSMGGQNFKAKIIGLKDVDDARGDKMCHETLIFLKAMVKAAGTHKQKIIINISLEGIKLIDMLSGTVLHHHAVHRISFISRDGTDARAFGYIYGPGDGTHNFVGIKTEKSAEAVVLTLRDLFHVVFEMKKKEVEEAKKKKEQEETEETTPKEEKEEQTKSEENSNEETTPVAEEKRTSNILDLETELGNLSTVSQGFMDMNLFGAAPTTPGSTASDPFNTAPSTPGSFAAFGPMSQQQPPQQVVPQQQQQFAAFPQQPGAVPVIPPRPGGGQPPNQMPAAFPPPAANPWATFNSPSPPAVAAAPSPAAGFGTPLSGTASPTNPFSTDTFGSLSPEKTAEPAAAGGNKDMFADLVGSFGTGIEDKPATPKAQMFEKPKSSQSLNAIAQENQPPPQPVAADDPFGFAGIMAQPIQPAAANSGTSSNNFFGNDLFG